MVKPLSERWIRDVWLLAISVVLVALLAGCSPPNPTRTPTPKTELGPLEGVRATLVPVAGPTEENPQVVVHLMITDEQTGEPVTAAFVSVDHKVVAVKVSDLKIALPGHLTEHTSLAVAKPGYKPWSMDVRWDVDHSRQLELPVRLEPVVGGNGDSNA